MFNQLGKPPPSQVGFSYVQCVCVSMCWLVDGTVRGTAWNGVVSASLGCSTCLHGVVNKFNQNNDKNMNQETCNGCGSDNTRLAVRARESKEEFGALQIIECRDCGRRWSE